MLLEAQLEKQLESATSDSNNYSEEMTQVGLHTRLSPFLLSTLALDFRCAQKEDTTR